MFAEGGYEPKPTCRTCLRWHAKGNDLGVCGWRSVCWYEDPQTKGDDGCRHWELRLPKWRTK